MVNIFDPRCQVPTFQQTDGEIVKMCAKNSGYIISAILTIFVVIFVISSIISYNKRQELEEKNTGKKTSRITGIVGIIMIATLILLLIWFGIPALLSFFSYNSWQGYQEQIKQLESQGYSHKKALGKLQQWRQSQMQAEATTEGAANIADAIRGNNN
jgi:heme/copper-type cytochrome/quinol oxidase subunit 2